MNNHSRKETHLYIMNIDENILSEEIKYYIETNNYAKDDKLPSERSLATLFNVSRALVRKSLISLVDVNYLYVKDKSGYYFNGFKETINLRDLFYLKKDSPFTYSVITTKRTKDKKIAKRMNISFDSTIIQVIMLVNDKVNTTSLMNVFLYSPDCESLKDQEVLEIIKTTYLNSKEEKGKIYTRDANEFELQLMNFDDEMNVYRWNATYTDQKYILHIEHSFNLEKYEFLGW